MITRSIMVMATVMAILTGTVAMAEPIVTESTTNSTVNSNSTSETTVNSPPPSAIYEAIYSSNSDICTVSVA